MPNYTKLFNSIITSTIWTEDDKTRIMWITMLAMADKNGEVHASIPGMARVSGMAVSDAEKAMDKLLSPDPYSRTPDNDGRRIMPIDGGWELLNHAKYRAMASKEDAKTANAERVRRHRERKNALECNENVTVCNGNVTLCNGDVTVDRDIAEAEADTEAFKENTLFFPIEESFQEKPKPTVSPEILRIGRILNPNRRPTTLLSDSEKKAFKACDFIEDEILMVEAFYLATERHNEPLHRRTGLLSLLNHWPDEVGKARAWAKKYGHKPTAIKTNEPLPPGYK